MLPKLMSEEELRVLVDDLVKTESDQALVATLMQYRFDAMLEGTEEEKNAGLSPALPVPELDREILTAQGKAVGLPPASNEPRRSSPQPKGTPVEPDSHDETVAPSIEQRRPTQDELMGYHDDDDAFDDSYMMDEPYD